MMREITLQTLKEWTDEIAPGIVHSDYKECRNADVKNGEDPYWDTVVRVPDMDDVAFAQPVIFQLDGWKSPAFESATYGDVIAIFAAGLKALGDERHVFYEGFRVDRCVGGVLTYVTLYAGS